MIYYAESRGNKSMEKMKKELEEMLQKIYFDEKALKYMHGFVRAFIQRYM